MQLDPNITFQSSQTTGQFLCIDKNSKQYNQNNELTGYRILENNGEVVKLPIPASIGIRNDIASSLQKVMPMMEHRLFGKPLYEQEEMNKGFAGKSIRVDEYTFIEDFIDTLPVKDLIYRQLGVAPKQKNEPQLVQKSESRKGRRKPLTSRGTGIYDRKLKKNQVLANNTLNLKK